MAISIMGYVYLIRLDSKLSHAQHYIGYTPRTPLERLETHRKGQGAKILAAAAKRGISFHIVRVWEDVDKTFEHSLKNRKKARMLCPIDNPSQSKHLYEHHKL